MLEILSLGAGVQSTTVLLMSIEGELPKLDYAIFADTGWEPKAVYSHLEWLRGKCEGAGIHLETVKYRDIRSDGLVAQVRGKKSDGQMYVSIPYYTATKPGQPEGMIRRQCTTNYKIHPIDKHVKRQILGLKPRQRTPKEFVVRQWFGISFDERMRQRTCGDKWRTYYYPLIEREPPLTRLMCLEWLESHGYPIPPRSACIGCPYHNNAEWREMQLHNPEEFEDACQFDEAIRKAGGEMGDTFLHSSCRPLREVDFRNDFDKGQLSLFDDECQGMCGV